MPTSLSDIKVKNSTSTLVIKPDDITINGVSIVGQNSFADRDLSNLSTAGQAVLNAKANNSDVVHKTGNETITGLKTIDTSHAQSLITKSNNIDNSITPTSTLFSNFIDAYDINNVLLSRVFTTKTTGGANGICIQAWKGSTNYGIQVLSDGTTHAPSSITHTIGNIKVSTDFQVVSALPSSPIAGVFYFVKE